MNKLIYIKLIFLVLIIHPIIHARQDTCIYQGWENAAEILQRISPPVFPDRIFIITKFGAVGDGKTDCTSAIKKAIDKCSASGGGTVMVPGGIFLTGAIHLKSNINFHVSKEAVVRFLTDPKKYLPVVFTRWEGVECMNYSPFIYAYDQENIAITGEGVLHGAGANENWWSWKGKKEAGWTSGKPNQDAARKQLFEMGENGVPVSGRVFGNGFYLRPNFFAPYKCKNILVKDVTFKDSPMWFLNPVLCENISIIGVTIEGSGPNNDGCDPESCTDVLIKNCFFNTGDDCIAIKSGRNSDGRRVNVPCENIVIQDCIMKNGHGGVVIGSEMSGGVRNVYAENCTMDSPNLDRVLRIKTNSIRGGIVENVFMRNIKVGEVAEAVLKIDFYYEEGDAGAFTPIVRNIDMENIISNKSKYGLWIRAYGRSPAADINIHNCVFNNVAESNIIENVRNFNLINVTINRE